MLETVNLRCKVPAARARPHMQKFTKMRNGALHLMRGVVAVRYSMVAEQTIESTHYHRLTGAVNILPPSSDDDRPGPANAKP
jgi:hypothetical protein